MSLSNTFLVYSNYKNGEVIFRVNCGTSGFKNTRKKTRYAINSVIKNFINKLHKCRKDHEDTVRNIIFRQGIKGKRKNHYIKKNSKNRKHRTLVDKWLRIKTAIRSRPVLLRLKSFSYRKKHVVKTLKRRTRVRFLLQEVTGLSYNGCRKKKLRRK